MAELTLDELNNLFSEAIQEEQEKSNIIRSKQKLNTIGSYVKESKPIRAPGEHSLLRDTSKLSFDKLVKIKRDLEREPNTNTVLKSLGIRTSFDDIANSFIQYHATRKDPNFDSDWYNFKKKYKLTKAQIINYETSGNNLESRLRKIATNLDIEPNKYIVKKFSGQVKTQNKRLKVKDSFLVNKSNNQVVIPTYTSVSRDKPSRLIASLLETYDKLNDIQIVSPNKINPPIQRIDNRLGLSSYVTDDKVNSVIKRLNSRSTSYGEIPIKGDWGTYENTFKLDNITSKALKSMESLVPNFKGTWSLKDIERDYLKNQNKLKPEATIELKKLANKLISGLTPSKAIELLSNTSINDAKHLIRMSDTTSKGLVDMGNKTKNLEAFNIYDNKMLKSLFAKSDLEYLVGNLETKTNIRAKNFFQDQSTSIQNKAKSLGITGTSLYNELYDTFNVVDGFGVPKQEAFIKLANIKQRLTDIEFSKKRGISKYSLKKKLIDSGLDAKSKDFSSRVNLFTMDKPALAARDILSHGIPKDMEPYLREGSLNLEGNFRKDFLNNIFKELIAGKFDKTKIKKTLETLGKFMDKNTIEDIQDKGLTLNKRLEYYAENSDQKMKSLREITKLAPRALLDGYELENPRVAKTMENAFSPHIDLTGSSKNLGFIEEKLSGTFNPLDLEALDKQFEAEKIRVQMVNEGYSDTEISKQLSKNTQFGGSNGWQILKGDNRLKDPILDKVLVGNEHTIGFKSSELEALFNKKVLQEQSTGQVKNVPYLTDLVNRGRNKKLSITEQLQVVKLSKALGLINTKTKNFGPGFYSNIFDQLSSLQAEYDNTNEWATLRESYKGNSGKYLVQALTSKAAAAGEATVDLGNVKGSSGRVIINQWRGKNVEHDWAWLKRKALVLALQKNPLGVNKDLISEYNSEIAIIEAQHEQAKLDNFKAIPKDNTINRSLSNEEFEMATKVQRLLKKHNGDMSKVSLAELDPLVLGNSLYKIRHPESFKASSIQDIHKEQHTKRFYSQNSLNNLSFKAAVTSTKGKKVIEQKASDFLNISSNGALRDIVDEYKPVRDRLINIGLRAGLDKKKLTSINDGVVKMVKTVGNNPIHHLAVKGVITNLSNNLEALSGGSVTKTVLDYFKNPEIGIKRSYNKSIRNLELSAFGNLKARGILAPDVPYSDALINSLGNKYKNYRNELYDLAGLDKLSLKPNNTVMPLNDFLYNTEKTSVKVKNYKPTAQELKNLRDNTYNGNKSADIRKHLSTYINFLGKVTVPGDLDKTNYNLTSLKNKSMIIPGFIDDTMLSSQDKSRLLDSINTRYLDFLGKDKDRLSTGLSNESLASKFLNNFSLRDIDKTNLDLSYWLKDLRYMKSEVSNPVKLANIVESRINFLASKETFLPLEKDKVRVLSKVAKSYLEDKAVKPLEYDWNKKSLDVRFPREEVLSDNFSLKPVNKDILLKAKKLIWSEHNLMPKILKFSKGGYIPGKSVKDEVPALLQKGEAVLTQNTVQDLGLNSKGAFDRFTKAAAEGRIAHFELGGRVSNDELASLGFTEEGLKHYNSLFTRHENGSITPQELITLKALDSQVQELTTNLGKTNSSLDNFEASLNQGEAKLNNLNSSVKNEETKNPVKRTKPNALDELDNFTAKLDNFAAEYSGNFESLANQEIRAPRVLSNNDLEGYLNGENLKASDFKSKEIQGALKTINSFAVENGISNAGIKAVGQEEQKLLKAHYDKLFGLQRDLIKESFKNNPLAKEFIDGIFKSNGAVGPELARKFSSLDNLEQVAIKQNLNLSGASKGYTKNITAAVGFNDHLDMVNNNLSDIKQLTGLNNKQFENAFGSWNKPITADNYNKLVNRISSQQPVNTQSISETDRKLNLVNKIRSAHSTLSTNAEERANLDSLSQQYTGKKNLQVSAINRVNNFKEQMINNAAFMGSYAVLGIGTSILKGTVGSAVEFQDRLKNLQAITGSTVGEMDLLTASVKNVAINTKFSASEVTDAATILGQAGYTATSINKSLGGVVKLATATGSSLEDATQTMTSALTIWDKSYSESASVANEFTAAVNKSKLDIKTLGLALQYSGNIAAQGNIPVEDVLTVSGLMKDAGIKRGSTLGTGQRMLFSDIIAPSSKFAKSLKAANISLQEFNKVFNEQGVIGVFKFMKDSGYNFQHATQGMEIRERTAYAAISNQIDKASGFKQSIIGTRAAEDANAIQLSSAKNRFKNMANSWAISFYDGIESKLEGSAGLFKALTINEKPKQRPLFSKEGKSYLNTIDNPEVSYGGPLSQAATVGLGAYGLYKGRGAISSWASKTKAMSQLAGEISPEASIGTKIMGKTAGAISKFTGELSGLTKGLGGTIAGSVISGLLALPKAQEVTGKTGSKLAGFESWSGEMLKSAVPIAAMAVASIFSGGLAVPLLAGAGAYFGMEASGANGAIDKGTNKLIKYTAGTSADSLFQDIAVTAENFSELQSNLGKTLSETKKDKTLKLLTKIKLEGLTGRALLDAKEKNAKIDIDNAQRNILSMKKAMTFQMQYNKTATELNTYMNSNVNLMKNIGLNNRNNQKQLESNIKEFQSVLSKAITKHSKNLLNKLNSTKLYAVASDETAKSVGSSETAFKSEIVSGKFNKAVSKIAESSPQMYIHSLKLINDKIRTYANSLAVKTNMSESVVNDAVKQAIKSNNNLAVASTLVSKNISVLNSALDDIKNKGKDSIYYGRSRDIQHQITTVQANNNGYQDFLGNVGELNLLKDQLAKTILRPLKAIDAGLKSSFSSFNRTLGTNLNSLSDRLAKGTKKQYDDIATEAANFNESKLAGILGGKANLNNLITKPNIDKLGKDIGVSGTSSILNSPFTGTIDALNTNTSASNRLQALDIKVMKSINTFIKDMPMFSKGSLALSQGKLINGPDTANSLMEYNFKKSIQSALDNAAPNQERMAFDKTIFKENLTISQENAKALNDISVKFSQAKIDYNYNQSVSRAYRNFDYNSQSIDIKAAQNIAKLNRQSAFSLSEIAIKQENAIRDLKTSKTRSIRDLYLSSDLKKASISRSKDYAITDLTLRRDRGLDKIALNTSRSEENVGIQYNRNVEKLNLSRARGEAKIVLNYTRNLEDAGISLSRNFESIGIRFNQNVEDAGISLRNNLAKASINFSRNISSLNTSRDRGYEKIVLNSTRSIEDLNIKNSRVRDNLNLNFNRQIENSRINLQRNLNKLQLNLSRGISDLNLSKNRGEDKIILNVTRSIEDLTISRERNIDNQRINFARQIESIGINLNRNLDKAYLNYTRNIENLNLNRERVLTKISLNTSRQIESININRSRNLESANINYGRQVDMAGLNRSRNIDKVNLNYNRKIEAINISNARSIFKASLNFRRATNDLIRKNSYTVSDAQKSYSRQITQINLNYNRTIEAIGRAREDTNTLFERALNKPVTLNIDSKVLLALSDKLSNVTLAMDANKASIAANTTAIKQWLNINKTKEDLVKEAYKTAYKASGGDTSSAVFNKTYTDYMNKNADKLVDVIVNQSVSRAQAGVSFDINKALLDPEYMKNQVSNPSTAMTTESAAIGSQVTTQQLVDVIYGIANGTYRATTTTGDVTQAKGEMGAARYDFQTEMLKLDLKLRDASIQLEQAMEDAATRQQNLLADILENYNRGLLELDIANQRSLEDINIAYLQAIEDAERARVQNLQDVDIQFAQTLQDLATRLIQTEEDINRAYTQNLEDVSRQEAQALQDLTISFSNGLADALTKYNQSVDDVYTNYHQAMEDAARRNSQALADIERSFTQGLQDIENSRLRAEQDLATSFTNSMTDLLTQNSRAVTDLYTNYNNVIEDITRRFQQAQQDSITSYNQGMEDILRARLRAEQDLETSYTQQMEDLVLRNQQTISDIYTIYQQNLEAAARIRLRAEQEAQLRYQQNLEDIARQRLRAEQDLETSFNNSMQDLITSKVQAIQDIARANQQSIEDLQNNFAQGMTDINTNVRRQLSELAISTDTSLAQIRQHYSDSMADIATKTGDMQAAVARQLQFNMSEVTIQAEQQHQELQRKLAADLAEIQVAKANAQHMLNEQIKELYEKLAIQQAQALAEVAKKQNDALRAWDIDSNIIVKKLSESYQNSLSSATFNSVILKQKLQHDIDSQLASVQFNASSIVSKIQAIFQRLASDPNLERVYRALGFKSVDEIVGAMSDGFSSSDIQSAFAKLTSDILATPKEILDTQGPNLIQSISGVFDNLVNTVDQNASQFTYAADNAATITGNAFNGLNQSLQSSGNNIHQYVSGLAQSISTAFGSLASSTSNAMSSIVNSGVSMAQSFGSMVVTIANTLASYFRNAMSAISNVFSHGDGHSTGTVIPGYGGGDILPVMLEPGEAVVRKEAVRSIGPGFFNRLNSNPSGLSLPSVSTNIINNRNINNSSGGGTNYNITIPVAPDASLSSIEQNLPTIADGVKKIFEEYL